MRKIFLLAIVPALLFATACKTSHGGNCNCPKFGQEQPRQAIPAAHADASEQPVAIQ